MERLEELDSRLDGMSYLVKRIVMNKGLKDEDLQAIEDRMDDDTSVKVASNGGYYKFYLPYMERCDECCEQTIITQDLDLHRIQ